MPGGREITGRDVHAALLAFGDERGDPVRLRALVRPDDRFTSYEALVAAAPAAAIGLSAGAHAALFAQLFGEFE